MPQIEVTTDERVLTVVVEGILARTDILAVVQQHYPTLGKRGVLWDLTRADFNALTAEDMTTVSAVVRNTLPVEGTRKVAYLVSNGASYAKACKYLNAAALARVPVEYSVFTDGNAARQWVRTR